MRERETWTKWDERIGIFFFFFLVSFWIWSYSVRIYMHKYESIDVVFEGLGSIYTDMVCVFEVMNYIILCDACTSICWSERSVYRIFWHHHISMLCMYGLILVCLSVCVCACVLVCLFTLLGIRFARDQRKLNSLCLMKKRLVQGLLYNTTIAGLILFCVLFQTHSQWSSGIYAAGWFIFIYLVRVILDSKWKVVVGQNGEEGKGRR